MMLREIQNRYTPGILSEALRRFGFAPDSIQELEGSAFVYEGLVDRLPRILKIVPGVWNTTEQITGSTREQILAEVDFVLYLAQNDLPVARPVPSRQGEWVEVIPIDRQACFLAYCFEKAPGVFYPDEVEVFFPEPTLEEWGRLSGRLHHGNFLVDGDKLTIFDFDAANYFWYAAHMSCATRAIFYAATARNAHSTPSGWSVSRCSSSSASCSTMRTTTNTGT